MGQKANPKGLRVGVIRDWQSKWYANKKNYAKILHQDFVIQKNINKELKGCGVSEIEIHRSAKNVVVNIHTSRPGMIIGRQGKSVDKLKQQLEKQFDINFSVNIKEIKAPDLNAKIVAENIAKQIENRMAYRRAAKMALGRTMDAGALGAKILVAGRLNGVEIARSEYFTKGKIPLHTFRANIDYELVPAKTTYGIIGIKVWIYKGEIFKKDRKPQISTNMTASAANK